MHATDPSHVTTLIEAIVKMPATWALTPCKGKANQWTGWNKAKLDRTELIEAIRTQKNAEGKHTAWTGVSIVTGPLSGGVMAVDFDGALAYKKFSELSGGSSYPTTKRWTSGKANHFQILLAVPHDRWETITATKFFILDPAPRLELDLSFEDLAERLGGGNVTIKSLERWESGSTSPIPPTIAKKLAEIYGCNNGELCQKLEFRWNECSTLPPSIHPDTGKPYFWKNEGEIAECPQFILDLMQATPAVELPKKPSTQNAIYKDDEKTLVDILENEILPRLDAEEFYGNWVALKKSGDSLKGLCPFHREKTGSFTVSPAEKLFKCFGCGVGGGPVQFLYQIKGGSGSPTGKEFAEAVRELAGKVGVQMPEFHPKSQSPKSNNQYPMTNNVLKHPANYTPEPAPAEEILSSVDELLAEELTPARQIVSSLTAAKRAGVPEKVLRELLAERQAEQELDWSILDSVSNFRQLHQIQNTPIDLREFFPPDLAKALLSKAESDRVDPVRIMQSVLPVVGTMLGGRVGIVLRPGETRDDDWVEYPVFYTVDISPPSTGKSATQGSILKPLKKMQASAQENLEEALIELEQIEEVWRGLSKEERAEKFDSEENPRVYMERHCKVRKWIFNRASAQALTKRIAEQQPMQGCLLLQDELAGFLTSFDQFTGGKGGEEEFLLEAWNGPIEGSVDRVDIKSNSYTFKRQTLSVTGTMQPGIARKVFNSTTDPNGMLSRFLPAISNIPDNFAVWSNVKVNINRAMTELIEGLERVPETLLTLPAPTEKIYKDYWEKMRQAVQVNLEENPAYSFFLGKQVGYVGRFAIVLHCIENLEREEIPAKVSPEIMQKAIRLSLFYCNQFLLLQSKSAQQQPIEGILLDILKFAQQQGGTITTRQLCQSRFKRLQIEGKKFSAYFAQKFLQAIADAGYGTFEQKTLNLLPLLPFVTGGVTALKPIDSKALSPVCRQNTKVYISENSETNSPSREADFSGALIDELDLGNSLENLSESENLENIGFGKTATPDPQTLTALEKDATTKRQQTATNGNKRQHLENSQSHDGDIKTEMGLNEDETELLEYLQKAVAENDAEFAQQVRGILKEVCDAGAVDRKKVWDALGDAGRKSFTELLAVEILPEVPEVSEVPVTEVSEPEKSLEVIIQELADGLVAAIDDGPAAIIDYAAQFSAENVERAIGLLESLKDHAAVEEIRDALG